jgi:dipeptidyl aminopeptidase/acylaminoacyl peptidase
MRPVSALSLLAALAITSGCGGGSAAPTAGHRAHRSAPRAHFRSHTGVASRGRRIAPSSLRGRIAYTHANQIWVANADGSRPRRVTRGRGPKLDPSWAPGGHEIVYRDSRHGSNRNDEIYLIGSDGRNARNLTRSPENEWSPSWSPGGRLIAYYSGELWAMRPDGAHTHAITEVEGEYPAWSADGRRLAFMSAEPNARGIDPNYDVFVVNRDGSNLRQLTHWPGEDGWARLVPRLQADRLLLDPRGARPDAISALRDERRRLARAPARTRDARLVPGLVPRRQ